MIKQREIAQKLGISVMTVSKALRNHPDLAAATRERVLRQAAEMGYTANPSHTAKTRRLGIVAYRHPDDPIPFFDSEIRRTIFETIQRECRRHHVEVGIDFPDQGTVPLAVQNRTVDGIFLFGRYTAADAARLQGVPALAVSSFISDSGLPQITADNLDGMRLATEHLLDLGHRRVLFLGIREEGSRLHAERADGYQLAMRGRGLEPEIVFLRQDAVAEVADLAVQAGAAACSSDSLAHHLLRTLRDQGRDPLRECSVVGFDNLVRGDVDFLTTYAPDWNLLGEMAVQLLLSSSRSMEGKGIKVTVPGRLVVRDSTRPPR